MCDLFFSAGLALCHPPQGLEELSEIVNAIKEITQVIIG
jgi:hypothetical protein